MADGMMMKMGTYVQSITVFMLLITSIISVMAFKADVDDKMRESCIQYATVTQNEINDIDKIFMTYPLLDRLYFEMYAHTPHIQKIKSMKSATNETPEMLKLEQHMASIIFQKIADIYFCEQLYDNTVENSVEWINTFKNWMHSPILRSHWVYLKYEHHPSVRAFIDRLVGGNPPIAPLS
jgi:tyrosyl-tRNA synthetase